MRNRTEMVSNTGSDYDENEAEFEGEVSDEDDWKPEPEVSVLAKVAICFSSRTLEMARCKYFHCLLGWSERKGRKKASSID